MPPRMDSQYIYAIQIRNIPPSSVSYPDIRKYLHLLLEKNLCTEVDKVELMPDLNRAIVALSKPIDLRTSSLHPLDVENRQCPLEALYGKVDESGFNLEVTWENGEITEDRLKLLFSNRNRSGGDRIRAFFFSNNDHRAVITFEEESVVARVLEKHQISALTLQGNTLDVHCLRPAFPPLLIHHSVDRNKLIMSEAPSANKHELETFLFGISDSDNGCCKITEVSYGYKNDVILIEFSTEPDYDAMLRLCRKMPFKGKMVGLQKVPLPTKIQVTAEELPNFEDLDLYFSHQDNGCSGDTFRVHIHESKQWAIVDYGDPEVVTRMPSAVTIMDTEVKVDPFYDGFGGCPFNYDRSRCWDEPSAPGSLERDGLLSDDNQAVTKELVCCFGELKTSGMIRDMLLRKFPELEVCITDKGLRLHGLPEHVSEAQRYFSELKFFSFSSRPFFPLLSGRKALSLISSRLQERTIDAVFARSESGIVILCAHLTEAKSALAAVDDSFKEGRIELESNHKCRFPPSIWNALKKYLLENTAWLGEGSGPDVVTIIALAEEYDTVMERTKMFLEKYKICQKVIKCHPVAVQLLQRCHQQKLDEISKRFSVTIEPTEGGFLVEAVECVLEKVAVALKELECSMKEEHFKPLQHFTSYLRTEVGQRQLSKIECKYGVLLQKVDQVLYTVKLSGKSTISIVEGYITSQTTDAIVSAVDEKLRPIRDIYQAGGESIQEECASHASCHLLPGQAFVTTSGRLQCKKLIHAVCPRWEDKSELARKQLQEAVCVSLQLADEAKLTSVTLYKIGSSGLPPREAASAICQAVDGFVQDQPQSLMDIRLVDTSAENCDFLVQELESCFASSDAAICQRPDTHESVYKVYFFDQKDFVATKEALIDLQDTVLQRYVFQEDYTGIIKRLSPEQEHSIRQAVANRHVHINIYHGKFCHYIDVTGSSDGFTRSIVRITELLTQMKSSQDKHHDLRSSPKTELLPEVDPSPTDTYSNEDTERELDLRSSSTTELLPEGDCAVKRRLSSGDRTLNNPMQNTATDLMPISFRSLPENSATSGYFDDPGDCAVKRLLSSGDRTLNNPMQNTATDLMPISLRSLPETSGYFDDPDQTRPKCAPDLQLVSARTSHRPYDIIAELRTPYTRLEIHLNPNAVYFVLVVIWNFRSFVS